MLVDRDACSTSSPESLAGRFGQLTELRNAIRHSRTLSDVAIKYGEAAVLWFDSMLARGKG